MQVYHKSLELDQAHFLSPAALISAFAQHGAELLAQGPSHWSIPPPPPAGRGAARADGGGESDVEQGRMWSSMLHFFCTGATPRAPADWDMAAWASRMRARRPRIEAVNLDLLFRLTTVTPPPGRSRGRADAGEQPWRAQGAGGGMLSQGSHAPAGCRLAQTKGVVSREFLMFVDRKKVEVVNEGDWRKLPALVAGPGQLLLQTVSSVVSTGNSVSVGAWCVCVCVCVCARARARACVCLRLLSVVSTGKAVTALHS